MERLFVYGTLAPNRPNEHILKDLVGTWEYSTVKGRLYQEGWGAQMGYPGVILDNEGQTIQGSIFSSPELSKKWEFLDDFEGEEYERVLVKAKLLTGEFVDAFIYALKKQ
jgi:gamma-glutamylcyclotransferase (GGCT)/AIG2-like uncharacterized protein YtfP